MSEFQAYAFRAVDRPLTQAERRELRKVSSRAEITSRRFTNTYSYGDLKANEIDLVAKYFDAMAYVANWGTSRLVFRVPAELIDVKTARLYEADYDVTIHEKGEFVLVELTGNREGGGEWLAEDVADVWLARLLPLREGLMQGDYRILYVGWLAALWRRENVEPKDLEPPVPPGLKAKDSRLRRLAQFLYLPKTLFEVGISASTTKPAVAGGGGGGATREELAAWVAGLPGDEKDGLLVKLMLGEASADVGRPLLLRARKDLMSARGGKPALAKGTRTGRDLLAEVKRRRQEATRQKEEAKAREKREEAERRARFLDSLLGREDEVWRNAELAIGTKKPAEYDQAVRWLEELRDAAERGGGQQEFARRLAELRERHKKKPSLIERLDKAGLKG